MYTYVPIVEGPAHLCMYLSMAVQKCPDASLQSVLYEYLSVMLSLGNRWWKPLNMARDTLELHCGDAV